MPPFFSLGFKTQEKKESEDLGLDVVKSGPVGAERKTCVCRSLLLTLCDVFICLLFAQL